MADEQGTTGGQAMTGAGDAKTDAKTEAAETARKPWPGISTS
jgi:hypothetical protein